MSGIINASNVRSYQVVASRFLLPVDNRATQQRYLLVVQLYRYVSPEPLPPVSLPLAPPLPPVSPPHLPQPRYASVREEGITVCAAAFLWHLRSHQSALRISLSRGVPPYGKRVYMYM